MRLLLSLSLFFLAAPALAKVAPAQLSSLKDVPWQDRFYDAGAGGAKVTVSGGHYELPEGSKGSLQSFDVVEVIYGDLTGDGVDEAVLFTRANTETSFLSQVDVYQLKAGALSRIGAAPITGYVSAVSLSEGKLTVETRDAALLITCLYVPERDKPKREVFVIKDGRIKKSR